jgi:cohesin complex subunit SCC1
MFYSQVILAKKGPLAKVWLAAHWGDKKLARPQIFATDISQSCTDIMNPSVPLALRLSGHLLLGVVRIYSRKVKYVLNDCTEAMLKLQMAFTKQNGGNGINGGNGGNGNLLDGSSDGKGRELLSDKDAPTHQLVSNFGEYDQVHVVEGFCLPLPEDNEWILAEDDDDDDDVMDGEIPQEQHLLIAARLPAGQQQHGGGGGGNGNGNGNGRSPDHVMASPEEETWAPFDPDNDEDDDDEDDDDNANKNNNDERSQVSDIEIVRAANESMLSEDQVRLSYILLY